MKKYLLALILVLAMAIPAFAGPTLQTSTDTAVAAPYFLNGAPAWGNPHDGGWKVEAGGIIGVTSSAQGTKSAWTLSIANGTAGGFGGAFGFQFPNFGFGMSGALSYVVLDGVGTGLGVDKLILSNNPDYASVGIRYEGSVFQANGISIGNGPSDTYAGGQNWTAAHFSGGSLVSSDGKLFGIDPLFPALAIGIDGAGALAGGYTIAGYIDTPNFASSYAKTVGFSGYLADNCGVDGFGYVNRLATVNNGGSFGQSYGAASFAYSGAGNFGYGVAQSSGWTLIKNTPISSSVTSFSSSSAHAATK